MTTALTRLAGSAFELTLTVPWAEIKTAYDKVFDEIAAEIEVEGFRKGKAPKEMVAGKVNKQQVFDEVVRRILPESYSKALTEHGLKPIINPKVEIISGEEEKDWQFIAKACEKPEIKLGEYKKEVSDINSKNKIWTPGQADSSQGIADSKETKEEKDQKKLNEIIEKLLAVCEVELPELLVESEVNRLMTELVDDIRAAGMSFDQYIATKATTAEKIRDNYRNQVVASLKLELILEEVANDLGITVEEKEINDVIEKETDATKKQSLRAQTYYLTSLLRRQKTLTKLAVL